MKKIFSYIGIITLVLISLIITEQTTTVIKETDEIMIKIKEEKTKYEQEYIDAKIEENKITPGLNGKKIDEKKSYEQMKKYGKYNPQYYIYEQIKPEISIHKIYDKYIEKGNTTKKEISIILLISQEQEEIGTQYNPINSKNKVTILKDNSKKEENKYFTEENCYIEQPNEKILKQCAKQNKHTIILNPIQNNLLKTVKETIEGGDIITISINENTKKELKLTINYIKNKGYKIVNLEELLSEKNTN